MVLDRNVRAVLFSCVRKHDRKCVLITGVVINNSAMQDKWTNRKKGKFRGSAGIQYRICWSVCCILWKASAMASALAEHAIDNWHRIAWEESEVLASNPHQRCVIKVWHVHSQPLPMKRETSLLPTAHNILINRSYSWTQQTPFFSLSCWCNSPQYCCLLPHP